MSSKLCNRQNTVKNQSREKYHKQVLKNKKLWSNWETKNETRLAILRTKSVGVNLKLK